MNIHPGESNRKELGMLNSGSSWLYGNSKGRDPNIDSNML